MPRFTPFDSGSRIGRFGGSVRSASGCTRAVWVGPRGVRAAVGLAVGLIVFASMERGWSQEPLGGGQRGSQRGTSQLESLLQGSRPPASSADPPPTPQALLRPSGSLLPPPASPGGANATSSFADPSAGQWASPVAPPANRPATFASAAPRAAGFPAEPAGLGPHGQGLGQPWSEESSLSATPVSHPLPSGADRDPLHQPLPGPSRSGRSSGSDSPETDRVGARWGGAAFGTGGNQLFQTGVALAVVLGLLFLSLWVFKRAAPRSLQPLPIETIQILGNAPLHGKQHLRLIRLGQRLLLLAVSETSAQTLAEVTDPAEVQQLLELCQTRSPQSVSRAFEALLQEDTRERASGFLGSQQDQLALHRRGATRGELADTTDPPAANRPVVRPASHHFFEA